MSEAANPPRISDAVSDFNARLWTSRPRWATRCEAAFDAGSEETISAFLPTQTTVPALLRQPGAAQEEQLYAQTKSDLRQRLFGWACPVSKPVAKAMATDPNAKDIVGLRVATGALLNELLKHELPWKLLALELDFAPTSAHLAALGSQAAFASLQRLKVGGTMKARLAELAALPFVQRLQCLDLNHTMDKAPAGATKALAAVPFENLCGLRLTTQSLAPGKTQMRPFLAAPWLSSLKHLELSMSCYAAPAETERLLASGVLKNLQSWAPTGTWSRESFGAALRELKNCRRLTLGPNLNVEGVVRQQLEEPEAEALVESGCVPRLIDTLQNDFAAPALKLLQQHGYNGHAARLHWEETLGYA